MIIPGSCCCGAVRFEITGPPSMMGTCHCTRCRKLGTATSVFVTRAQFNLIQGADQIEVVAPAPPYKYARSFCRRCGTSLGEPLSTEASFPINAHCLDGDPGVRNAFHEFVAEKPDWSAICDGAQVFEGHPDPA